MPKHLTAKNKIIVIILAWLVLSTGMLMYFFKYLNSGNQLILDSMGEQKKILASLQAERESETRAQRDLQELAQKSYQPEDFFSRDTSLVNEIKILESLGQKYNLKMQLSGVSGTVNTAPKAKTTTALVIIPYSISLNGNLKAVANFVETLENLSFITNVGSITIGAADKDTVTASLSANFYLRK